MDHGVNVVEAGRYAEVVLDRPPVNAVSRGMYSELILVFRALSARTDVHAVLLRSANEKIFSAGADIRETPEDPGDYEPGDEYRQRLARTCYEAILDCALPTIALVNGPALGAGAALAACCDIRVAAESARIGLPEINVGRCGGGRYLARLVGQGTVRMMYFTGEPIDAQQALAQQIVQAVHPDSAALEQARAFVDTIARKSPYGLRQAKQALNDCEDMELRAGYAREQQYTIRLGRTPDAAEASRAVIEKRDPVWSWNGGG
jgi:enoyl-CoA hydratase